MWLVSFCKEATVRTSDKVDIAVEGLHEHMQAGISWSVSSTKTICISCQYQVVVDYSICIFDEKRQKSCQ